MVTEMNPLDNITVVLVQPQGPRNIGSAARALKNFGLNSLRIVGDADLEHDECRQMGVGAHDILEGAEIFDSFDSAVEDLQFLVGTTARRRHRRPMSTPAELAPEIIEIASQSRVGLLFGREDFGLFSEELVRCHRVISVVTSSERSSLNLAQAVLLVAYELYRQEPVNPHKAHSDAGRIIDGAQWQRLYREMLDSMEEVGYMHDGSREAIEKSLERILTLGPLQTRDARHLFGFVRAISRDENGESGPGDQSRDDNSRKDR